MNIDLSFPHSWQAQILRERPLILPSRQYTYPHHAEEVERGALEAMIRPAGNAPFLATFALGFADPAVPTGIWSCPGEDELCAVAGGYAYVLDTMQPERFTQIGFRPVLEVRSLAEHGLLLFAGHNALMAWGAEGPAWESPRLSSEGVRLETIEGDRLHGFGWDLMTDREVAFTLDLRSGQRIDIPGH